jgi:flagellar basal body-associated protein FliL
VFGTVLDNLMPKIFRKWRNAREVNQSMDYSNFLGIQVSIPLLIGITLIAGAAAFFLLKNKGAAASPERRIELPEAESQKPETNIVEAPVKPKPEDLLFKLERQKRAVSFGYHLMNSTHQAATKAKLQKIEEQIGKLKAIRDH